MIDLAVDAHGMPVRVRLTEDSSADGQEALALIGGFAAEHLLTDRR